MAAQAVLTFGELLRRLRVEARLTQEELAEAARLSPRSISDLERGVNRTARKDTAELLAGALDLAGPTRKLFLAAARGRGPAQDVLAAREGTMPAALRQRLPAPSAPARHNLPMPLTTFLGREQALVRLDKLLGEARLVTLTGTGGAGKTRLAVEVGARAVGRFPDGVWLADLAAVTDPGLVAVQVMEALGVRQAGDVPVVEALRFRLRSADLLLVLDNCEHLLDGCVQLAHELLGSSPGLRVLATSREPLGMPGEVSYLVPPLELPADPCDAQAAATAPAVRLFLERGSAARGGGSDEVVPVAAAERICRKLDGLPLAIELAAARLGTLSAAEIEAHLTDRFRFLAYRRPAAHPRHQALQAAMDWSYELLSAEERQMFGELSVFAGTFGREQAAMVCGGGDDVTALEVIDRLAVKSLVTAEPAEEGTRYRLLETVRQYAAARLAQAGGTESARRRHALAFLALAEREHQLAALARDHDNLRAALDWSLSAGNPAGPRLARALGNFWLGRGLLQEGRGWLERALTQTPMEEELRTGLLRLLGTVLFEVGDLRGAGAVLSDGLEMATAAGAFAEQARIQVQLTEIHTRHLPGEDGAGALEECEAAIAVLDAAGDLQGLADAWLLAGKLRFDRNEWPAALEAMERAIAFGKQSGNHRAWIVASHHLGNIFMMSPIPADIAVERAEHVLQEVSSEPYAEEGVLMSLAIQYAYTGRIADARAAIARSKAINNGFASKLGLAFTAFSAGEIEMIAGDPAAAERCYREGYEAFRAMGERGYLGHLAGLLAEALYAQDRLDEAQQMIEEAETTAVSSQNHVWVLWRSAKAKVLARRGQFAAAKQLIAEAEEGISSAPWMLRAMVPVAKAEVSRLAGDPDQAAASLNAALRIYEDRHAVPLAERVKALLASLSAPPGQGSG